MRVSIFLSSIFVYEILIGILPYFSFSIGAVFYKSNNEQDRPFCICFSPYVCILYSAWQVNILSFCIDVTVFCQVKYLGLKHIIKRRTARL